MSVLGTYNWGKTRIDKFKLTQRIDLKAVSDSDRPGASTGRLIRGADGKLRYCQDGSNFEIVTNE